MNITGAASASPKVNVSGGVIQDQACVEVRERSAGRRNGQRRRERLDQHEMAVERQERGHHHHAEHGAEQRRHHSRCRVENAGGTETDLDVERATCNLRGCIGGDESERECQSVDSFAEHGRDQRQQVSGSRNRGNRRTSDDARGEPEHECDACWCGNLLGPSTGATMVALATRTETSSVAISHPMSIRNDMGASDVVGNAADDLGGEASECAQHPAAEQQQRRDRREQLRHEGQR